MKKLFLIIFAVIIIVGVMFILRGSEDRWLCENGQWIKHGQPSEPQPAEPCGDIVVTNFNDCILAGNVVMESYPRKCQADGITYIEDIGNEMEKINLIRIDSPRPNQIISSPLVIKGQAVGYWFFEGDFPVVLVDWDGLIIAEGIAQAQGEWMTEEFVPYQATLNFTKPDTAVSNMGTLILRRDNPSGLPENDDALEVPIKFTADQPAPDDKKMDAVDSVGPNVINLSGQGLSSFPTSVLSKTKTEVLNLSNNNLTSLPSEIGELTNLKELYLDNNNLTGSIVAEIRKMPGLKILSAKSNQLTGIPAEIGQLKNLVRIDFSNNQLDTYPNELGNLKNNLQILNLSANNYSLDTIIKIEDILPNTQVIY